MSKRKVIYGTLLLLALTSCMQKTTSTRSSSSSSSSSSDTYDNSSSSSSDSSSSDQTDSGSGYGDGEEDGVADAGQTQDYITISNISLHGSAGLNRYSPTPMWSSKTNIDSSDQGIFYTDSRFNIRVRPQAAPSQSSYDSNGVKCAYIGKAYKKLSIDVCVRKSTGSCIYTKTFEEVTVGQVSKIKEFTISSTTEPLVVEILDVKWDYSCQNYLDQGYSETDSEVASYCPMALVWDTSCIKFDIQFSTDYTKDFPTSSSRY